MVIILLFKYRKQFGSGIPEGAVVKYKDAVNEAKTQEFQDAYKNMVIVDDEPNYLIDDFNPMDFNYEWKDTQNYSEEYNAGLPLQISKSTLYYEFKKDLYFVNFEITKNYENIKSLSLSFMFKDKDDRIIKVYNSEKLLLQNNNISHYLLKVPNGASMVSISIDSINFDNDLSWNGKSNTYHFFWNK